MKHPSFVRAGAVAAALLLSTGALAGGPASRGATVPQEALIEEIKKAGDNADVAKVRELANLRTGEALDGLLSIYGGMSSMYMRRAVLQGLVLFDEVPGLERRALQKITDAATDSSEREMREIAVDLLAGCRNFGKAFLAMIVESSADDDVRERALRHHTASPRQEDRAWYRTLYETDAQERKRPRAEGDKRPHPLGVLRFLAFDALAGDMSTEDLVEALKDKERKIRVRALEELAARNDPKALESAEDLYKDLKGQARDRLVGARILARAKGPDIGPRLIDDATRRDTPEELALGLADILVALDDAAIDKLLLKGVGKGKGLEEVFYVRATRHIEDPKLQKAILKLLKDKDPRVQREAMVAVAARRDREALPELEKIVEKSKDEAVVSNALDAISEIRRGEADWQERLVELAKSENAEVRNGALEELGKTRNLDYLPILAQALEHPLWSTRLAAARAIEHMETREGIGAIALRIQHESGRMAHELADVLWRTTGRPYQTNGKLWAKWWEEEGADFELIDPAELRKLEREEEERRLRQITKTQFFGIRIVSHRVLFILDVSGSMADPTRGKYVGDKGDPRIDVAKRELTACLEGLDRKSFFNVIVFAGGVESWQDQISEVTEESRGAAKAWVGELTEGGGTNLYGALRLAFDDPDVDTIYLLSDGEPSVGDVIDPGAIRSDVAEWNEHRGVTIHSIAVGGSLQLLEQLAEDTGGDYIRFP